jgi:hypothetical protein
MDAILAAPRRRASTASSSAWEKNGAAFSEKHTKSKESKTLGEFGRIGEITRIELLSHYLLVLDKDMN